MDAFEMSKTLNQKNTIGSILTSAELFLVLLKNGQRQFVLAESEDDLPVNIEDVAFAANLLEMEEMVKEMRRVMEMGVDDGENGLVCGETNKGDRK